MTPNRRAFLRLLAAGAVSPLVDVGVLASLCRLRVRRPASRDEIDEFVRQLDACGYSVLERRLNMVRIATRERPNGEWVEIVVNVNG